MPDSNIIANGLVARPGVQQITLEWEFEDVVGPDYLTLDAVEVWSAAMNDRAFASKVGEGRTHFPHTGLAEEVTRYYWIRPRTKAISPSGERYYGEWWPVSDTAGISARAIGMSGLAFGMANGQLVADIGNNLVVEVLTKDGSAPSEDNPIFLALPSFDGYSGGYEISRITTSLSKFIGDGSTLGVPDDDTPFRIWVVMMDDAGTPRLGLINCAQSGENISTLDESQLVTMVEGGSGASADSAGVIYGDVDLGPAPFRILGSLTWEDGLPTVGHWDTAPSSVQLFGRGSKTPGDVIRTSVFQPIGISVCPTNFIADDTIPILTDQIISMDFHGSSKTNYLDIDITISLSVDIDSEVYATLIAYPPAGPAGGVQVICAAPGYGVADQMFQLRLEARASSPGPDGMTYAVRVGAATPGAVITVNGVAGLRLLGGKLLQKLSITEIVG